MEVGSVVMEVGSDGVWVFITFGFDIMYLIASLYHRFKHFFEV